MQSPATPAPNPSGNLVGVQVLRGVAAMMVVLCHASQMVHHRMGYGEVLFFGAAGVDLFFPISGFVMAVTTYPYWGRAGRAVDFLVRRLIRIVPLYWAATLLKALVILLAPSMVANARLDPWHVTASFLFIPAWDADHRPFPLIPIGWTLQFEMFFYALFTLVLALRLQPVPSLAAILLLVSWISPLPALGAVAALGDPILLEFVAGMLVGWATVTRRHLPGALALLLLPLAFAALIATQGLNDATAFGWRLAVWGLPGVLALAAVVALEPVWPQWLRGWPARIGDASYAIYLSHGFILPVIGVVCLKLNWRGESARWPIIVATCLLAAVVGQGVHRWVEQPVTRWLGQAWRRQGNRMPKDGNDLRREH